MKSKNLNRTSDNNWMSLPKLISIQRPSLVRLAIFGGAALSILSAQSVRSQSVQIRSVPIKLTVSDNFSGSLNTSNSIVLSASPGNEYVSVSGLPASGLTCTFSVTNGSASYFTVLTNTFATCPNGIYTLDINATNSDGTANPASADYYLPVIVGRQWTNAFGVWSAGTNWNGGTIPGTSDTVIFTQAASQSTNYVTGVYTPDCIVDQNFQVGSVRFSQTNNNFHTVLIQSNVTLSVTGPGGFVQEPDWTGLAKSSGVSIGGTNGTLVVSNYTANFLSLGDSTSSPIYTWLDMASLGNFQANVNQVGIGDTWKYPYSPVYRAMGYGTSLPFCYPINPQPAAALAMTNNITAVFVGPDNYTNVFTRNYAIGICRGPNKSNSSSDKPYFYFGIVNNFYADSICFGGPNATTMPIAFNPAFTTTYKGGLTATFRNTNGVDRVSLIAVGDNTSWMTNIISGNLKPTLDFSAGAQDILVDRMYIAMDGNNVPSGGTSAQVSMSTGTGTVDANNLYIGSQLNGDQTGQNYAAGTLTVNSNCTVKVNNTLYLGYETADYGDTSLPGTTSGRLIVNKGGQVWVNSVNIGGPTKNSGKVGNYGANSPGANTIQLNSGSTLVVSNTIGDATALANSTHVVGIYAGTVGALTISSATLQLNLDGNNPTAVVYASDIGVSISTATLKIGSVANLSIPNGQTAELPVFLFAGSSGAGARAASFSQVLMPPGYHGTLVQNPTNSAMLDILISTHIAKNLRWLGSAGSSDWDTTTYNWYDMDTGFQTNFVNGDSTTFDDSSSYTNVNITSAIQLIPGNILVTNTVRSYTFSGSGTFIGGSSIAKAGTNSLEVDVNTTFGVTVSQGILTGNASSAVASVTTSTNTTLNYAGTIGAGGLSLAGVGLNHGAINGPVTIQTGGAFTNYNQVNAVFATKSASTFKNDAAGTITYASGTSTVSANSTFINGGTINADVVNNSGTFIDLGSAVGAGMTLTSLGDQSGGVFIPGGGSTNATVIGNSGTGTFPGAALLSLNSTNIFEIDVANNHNTVLQSLHLSFGPSATTRSQGGCTLVLTNISALPFAAGQSFHLFDNQGNPGAAPYDTGTSTNTYPAIIPVVPGPGLTWDLSHLWTSGNIGVVTVTSGPTLTNSFTVSGKQVIGQFSWDPGYLGYRLQSLTENLNTGLSGTNWVGVGGSWTNLTVSITNNIDTSNSASVFYRLVFP